MTTRRQELRPRGGRYPYSGCVACVVRSFPSPAQKNMTQRSLGCYCCCGDFERRVVHSHFSCKHNVTDVNLSMFVVLFQDTIQTVINRSPTSLVCSERTLFRVVRIEDNANGNTNHSGRDNNIWYDTTMAGGRSIFLVFLI